MFDFSGLADILTSIFGGGGGGEAAAGAGASGGELALGTAGAAGDVASAGGGVAAGAAGDSFSGLLNPQLLGLGLKGAEFGYGLANQPGKTDATTPANLVGQQNPGLLRQRSMGASADLQSKGLDVGASPDFLQKQLESELGLTPDEFQRIFRLGGGEQAGGGGGAV